MRIISYILFLVVSIQICAQEKDYVLKPPRDYDKNPAKNAAFIELGGNAGLYSLNFDRIYFYKEKLKVSARAGFAPIFVGRLIEQRYVLENNFILFPNQHHLEIGVGATMHRSFNQHPIDSTNYFWENIWYSVLRCGYRYQKKDDGFFLRLAVTPVFFRKDVEGFHPNYFQFWIGASAGLSF